MRKLNILGIWILTVCLLICSSFGFVLTAENIDTGVPINEFNSTVQQGAYSKLYTTTTGSIAFNYDPNSYISRWKMDNVLVNATGDIIDTTGTYNVTLNNKTFNHGTVSGGVTIDNGSMVFDGVDGYVSPSLLITDTSDISISGWFKIPNSQSITNYVNQYTIFANTANSNLRLGVVVTKDKLNFVFGGSDYTGYVNRGANIIDNNLYYFTAIIEDGSTKLYVNNVLQSSTVTWYGLSGTIGSFIGKRTDLNGYLDGSIYSLAFYNRSLSELEMADIYEAGKDAYSPISDGLIAQYSGRDFAGTTSAPTTIYDTNHLSEAPVPWLNASINFKDGSEFIDLLPNNILNWTDDFSIMFWDFNSGNVARTVYFSQGTNSFSKLNGLIDVDSSGLMRFNYYDGLSVSILPIKQLGQYEWNHIAIVRKDSTVRLLVNGVQTISFNRNNMNNLDVVTHRITGRKSAIADFRIYTRAVSDIEINTIYTNNNLYNVTTVANRYSSDFLASSTLLSNHLAQLEQQFSTINVTAFDVRANMSLNNFTVTVFNSELLDIQVYSTSSGLVQANITKGYNYTFAFDAEDYATHSEVYETTLNVGVVNADLFITNSILMNFYDVETGNLITGDNITIILTGSLNSQQYTTNQSEFFISNLPADNYSIDILSTNYAKNTYYATVTNRSTQNLDAYLISSGLASTIFTFRDDTSENTLQDITLTIERIVNGQWTIVNVLKSDITGRITFNYQNNVRYRFTTSNNAYETKTFILDPVIFSTYNIFLKKTSEIVIEPASQRVYVRIVPSTLINQEINVTASFISPQGELTNYGINIEYNNETYSLHGSNMYGSTLRQALNLTTASPGDVVIIQSYFYTSDGSEVIKTQTYLILDYRDDKLTHMHNYENPYGLSLLERVLITMIIMIILVGMGYISAGTTGASLLLMFGFGYLSYIGFISWWFTIPSMIVIVLIEARRVGK
jgi:hypothetical protein